MSLLGLSESRGALLSDDSLYRYRLWRLWQPDKPIMVWVMLNPSTADASRDDQTLKKCMGFARANHYDGGVILVNLFAWRAGKPCDLELARDPVGPGNDEHVLWACGLPGTALIAGWGATRFGHQRALFVRELIKRTGRSLHCIGTTKDGYPRHPLHPPYSSHVTEY